MWTILRKMVSPLLLYNFFRGRQDLVKIRAAQAYVGGVKKMRIICLGCLFMLSALVLLFSGLFLFHTALLTYSPWSMETKFRIGLMLGVLDLGIAGGIMVYLFKEESWSRLFGVAHVVDSIVKDKSSPKEGRSHGGNGKLHR